MRVLLNIDAGESDAEPSELYVLAHVLNVACGAHAGDDALIERVVRAAAEQGARAGVHPSYPDREGFGRRSLTIDDAELADSLREQCQRVASIASRLGVRIEHAKLHGALYHDADRDEARAALCVGAIRGALGDVIFVGSPWGAVGRQVRQDGLRFEREGFADRGLRPDGSLIPRGEPGARVEDPALAARQARRLVASKTVDTLCVHGDSANAVDIARAVRVVLDAR